MKALGVLLIILFIINALGPEPPGGGGIIEALALKEEKYEDKRNQNHEICFE